MLALSFLAVTGRCPHDICRCVYRKEMTEPPGKESGTLTTKIQHQQRRRTKPKARVNYRSKPLTLDCRKMVPKTGRDSSGSAHGARGRRKGHCSTPEAWLHRYDRYNSRKDNQSALVLARPTQESPRPVVRSLVVKKRILPQGR